jgi:hypothetical protein
MKTAVIISSFAIVVNGFPDVGAHVNKRLNHMMSGKTLPKAKTVDDVSTESVKDETLEIQSHKGAIEVAYGFNCNDLTAKVSGFQTEVCVDAIVGNHTDENYGKAFSYKFETTSGSDFPNMVTYWGHQCRSYLFEQPFIDSAALGFPAGYQVGTCHTFTDPSGNPIYSGKISWSGIMTDPQYPHAMRALSNKARNCDKKSKFFRYDIEGVLCLDDQDEDGTVRFYTWDLTQCESADQIRRNYYLDSNCATYNHTEIYYRRHCEFDTGEFVGGFENDDAAQFTYVYQNCQSSAGTR